MNIKTKIKEKKYVSAGEAESFTKVYLLKGEYFIRLVNTENKFLNIGFQTSEGIFTKYENPLVVNLNKETILQEFGDFNCEVVEL
jgi:hypothetical protein